MLAIAAVIATSVACTGAMFEELDHLVARDLGLLLDHGAVVKAHPLAVDDQDKATAFYRGLAQ